jgi:hypothetical protein
MSGSVTIVETPLQTVCLWWGFDYDAKPIASAVIQPHNYSDISFSISSVFSAAVEENI